MLLDTIRIKINNYMLKIGSLSIKVPIVLSPMADYTNLPYRLLCSKNSDGLFIEEMISSKAINNAKKPIEKMIDTSKDEKIRSVQLYVLGPNDTYDAIQKIKDNNLADHIDLNFGCPVKKVTKNGGGSAIPWKTPLFTSIIKSAVKSCGSTPLTIKLRLGIDNNHITYLESGKIAYNEGVDGIILHTRTTSQYYHGDANWSAIEKLKKIVNIPIIGNGNVISISDFQKMLKNGADGVAIGRGALGRPWIFEQISNYYLHNIKPKPILLKNVIDYVNKHLELMLLYTVNFLNNKSPIITVNTSQISTNTVPPSLITPSTITTNNKQFINSHIHFTKNNEQLAIKLLRKFYIYYFKGVNIGGNLRNELVKISTIDEQKKVFEKIVKKVGLNTPINEKFIRGRQGNMHKVSLPYGWLDNRN
jgi:nifR3 family TIM-barrel protein